ncbi:MAG: dipeptidase [Dokdonella sp.]
MKSTAIALLLCAFLLRPALAAPAETLEQRATALHNSAIVLDTHLDTPMLFARPDWRIGDRHSFDADFSQVDYPRMVEGGLDGGFWVIYTPQGERTAAGNRAARDFGLKRLVEIREMVAANADRFEIALSADDAARIKKAGKRIVYISMENASPLASDPSLLGAYYDLGLRMLGLVHSSNDDFADSSTNPGGPEFNGLSDKGRALVAEANRLGLIIDLSHASNAVFDQVVELSKTPVVLSHTASAALNAHPRNIDDARLRKLAATGGVIQVNSVNQFLIKVPDNAERDAEVDRFFAMIEDGAALSAERRKQAMQLYREIEAKYPTPKATFEDYMKHMLHILEVAGPEHVGLGADWDGGGGVSGMIDVTSLPKITERLLREGYSEDQVRGVLGGNLLRVMRAVEAARQP